MCCLGACKFEDQIEKFNTTTNKTNHYYLFRFCYPCLHHQKHSLHGENLDQISFRLGIILIHLIFPMPTITEELKFIQIQKQADYKQLSTLTMIP